MIRRPGRAVGSMTSASAKVSEPSMEEILASIRRIIADDQDSAHPPPSDPMPPSPARPTSAKDDVLDIAALRAVRARDTDDEDEPEDPDDTAESAPADEVDPDPAEAYGPPASPKQTAPRAESLLSETAQSAAASAFQRLSTSVLASQPRTLEDVMIEMLRPMLKVWLDENLPPLVERLVRAEIERVAR